MDTRTDAPLLALERFSLGYRADGGTVRAVERVDLALRAGESLAIVGESGCGKSSLALGILRLFAGWQVELSGHIRFQGEDLLAAPLGRPQDIRGREIATIFQDPRTSLNPYLRIGLQVAEPARRHLGFGARAARAHALDLLRAVGIPEPESRIDRYPHEFSGGMRQRAMIAAALACSPRLLIADEPTTALDVTIQAQILRLLRAQMAKREMALLLITHDLGVVAGLCDRVAIMYAGQVVETGSAAAIYANPCHPYTRALLQSVPRVDRQGRLRSIPGQPPVLTGGISACAFSPRCPHAQERCRGEAPPLRVDSRGREHRCFFELPAAASSVSVAAEAKPERAAAPEVLLSVRDLHVRFPVCGGWWGRGLGNGFVKGYLPAARSDFIFAVICEEMGMIGAIAVIALLIALIWNGRIALSRCQDPVGRLLAFGITLMIGMQAAMNIAVVTVSVPTKGIALPLVSAAGSGAILMGGLFALLANIPRSSSAPSLASEND